MTNTGSEAQLRSRSVMATSWEDLRVAPLSHGFTQKGDEEKFDWIDYSALYPSVLIHHNMRAPKDDLTQLPRAFKELLEQRKAIKSELLNDYKLPSKAQQRRDLQKIEENSKYGKKGSEPDVECCAYCSNPCPGKQCSGCHSVRYCDKDCQKEDWKEHRKSCSTK